MTDVNIRRAVEVFDLGEYLAGKGAREIQRGQWLLTCPLCGKPKLTVHADRKAWHCWVCEKYGYTDPATGRRQVLQGAGGLLDLIQLLERWTREKAADYVLTQTAMRPEVITRIDFELAQAVIVPDRAGPAPTIPVPEFARPIDAILPYMIKRKLTMEDARQLGLFYCVGGRYVHRLIFPVYEEGRLVYFQGRAMWEARPGEDYKKSLNPPRQPGQAVSSEVLMNLDVARCYQRVAITEGPVDCAHAGPSAVATFGKKISGTQIAKLLRAGVRALDLMWDGPSPKEPHGAWPEMMEVAPTLAALFDLRLVFIPQGDPGDWPREALNQFRAQARPYRAQFAWV